LVRVFPAPIRNQPRQRAKGFRAAGQTASLRRGDRRCWPSRWVSRHVLRTLSPDSTTDQDSPGTGPPAQVQEECVVAQQKFALVPGAGKRRVGSYVAEALAQRGYALAIHYRQSATEAAEGVAAWRQRGIDAVAFQADLSDERAVQALVQKTLDRFGR